jgi:putative ABC transport system permease protein
MGDLLRDLRPVFLRLYKNAAMSLVIILTLALCIGTSTALFSIIKGALIDPWPYKGPDRIMVVRGNYPKLQQTEMGSWSIPEFVDLSSLTSTFEHVIAGIVQEVNLTDTGQPEHVHAVRISANVFPMLGVKPLLGRVFTADEDRPGGEKLAVMGYGLWERRYGSDPGVIGKNLLLAGESYKILGVMPKRFTWWSADLYFPLGIDLSSTDRSQRRLTLQAQLRPGVSLQAAQAQVTALSRRIDADHRGTNPEYQGFTIFLKPLADQVLRDVRPSLVVLLCFMILVFLLACANVANLLLAEAASRNREMAVRTALGASRGRIVWQLMLESLMSALPAGVLGLGLAVMEVRLVLSLIPQGYIPSEAEITVDPSAVAFNFGLALLAAFFCGLLPARQASKPAHLQTLREGGARSTGSLQVRRFQDVLVIGEVVLSLVVLAAAGLMIQSYARITALKPGYDPSHVLTFRLALPADRYAEGSQISAFVNEVTRRIQAISGVQSVGAINSLPLTNGPNAPVAIEGTSADELGVIPDADVRIVTPGYFASMRILILQGRNLGDQDVDGSLPVALVNETMARRFWRGKSPLGQRMKMADGPFPWLTVVGVVGDTREQNLGSEPRQAFFMPQAQRIRVRDLAMVVRSSIPPESLSNQVRKVVQSLDPSQPIHKVQTMDEIVVNSLGAKRLTLVLLAIFGFTSLLLAAVGIFAVLSNLVANRRQEIGIRMAMGAQLGAVVRLFVSHGMKLTTVGIVLGILAALFSSRVLSSLVYGVSTSDPLTFAGVTLLFAAIAALASYIPARRAARVDPVGSLYSE